MDKRIKTIYFHLTEYNVELFGKSCGCFICEFVKKYRKKDDQNIRTKKDTGIINM